MIIARLIGGLGNQMFQYASAKALAISNNTSLKLDLGWFDTQSARKYLLGNLNIKEEIAATEEILHFTGKYKSPFRKAFWLVTRPFDSRKVFREPGYDFNDKFLRQKKSTYLKGNWQSPLYFMHIESLLREIFIPSKPLSASTETVASDIRSTNSVSLHIRRGDYISNSLAQSYHGNLGMDYYLQAVQILSSRTENPVFFIFSDDMEWVSRHVNIPFPTRHITGNNEENCHEDMYLMSLCRNHIIANSSFSWWGAWLDRNPGKIVVAPMQWFAAPEKNAETGNLIPEGWIRI